MGKETKDRVSAPSTAENSALYEDFSHASEHLESSSGETASGTPTAVTPSSNTVQPSLDPLSAKQIRARQRVMGNQEVRRQIDHQRDGARLLNHHEQAHASGADIIRRRFGTMATDPTVDHMKQDKGNEGNGGQSSNAPSSSAPTTTAPTPETTTTASNGSNGATATGGSNGNQPAPAPSTETTTTTPNDNLSQTTTAPSAAPTTTNTNTSSSENSTTQAPETSTTASPNGGTSSTAPTTTSNGNREGGQSSEENAPTTGDDGTDEGDGPRVGRRRGNGNAGANTTAPTSTSDSSQTAPTSSSSARQAKDTLRGGGGAGGAQPAEAPDAKLPPKGKKPNKGGGANTDIDQLQSNGPISTDLGPNIQLSRDTTNTIQRAPAGGGDGEMLMPEPPEEASPQSKARMAQVKGRMGQKATNDVDSMTPPEKNVGDADKATKEPETEQNAKAEDRLVEQLGARPAPSPQIEEMCKRIYNVIKAKRPPDEDSLVDAQPDQMAKAAGQELNSSVKGQVDKVEGSYDPMEQDQKGQPSKQPTPPPKQPDAPNSPDVKASEGAPDAVPGKHTDLSADVAAQQAKREEAGMESEPAKLVDDPSNPIVEARKGQEDLEKTAKEDPKKIQQKQDRAIKQAEADMDAMQARALAAIEASRARTVTNVTTQQGGAVQSQEQMRESVGRQANTIFDQAQTQVNSLMKDLPQTAMSKWDAGVTRLSTTFKSSLSRVKAWIDERHNNVLNVIGDAIFGLPDWVTEEYDRAEKAFGDGVTGLLREISTDVNTIVASAQSIIQKARDDINKLYDSLPAELRGWAEQEKGKFGQKLNTLSTEVNTARDNFEKDLIKRAGSAVQEVRQEIHGLREKAKGILGKIADAVNAFLDDPAKFIIDGLLKLVGIEPSAFWALVNKISSSIDAIAKDPMGFANNLVAALKAGFQMFFDNIGTHLLDGLLKWLFSRMGDVGVSAPKDFSLPSIITFFLQVMGISWAKIRKILAKHLGEKNIAMIEQAWGMISTLIEKGPQGIFDMIKEALEPAAILDMILKTAIDYVVETLIKQVAIRLIGMLNPAGAIAQAIEVIYKVLKWVFNNAAKIFALVETIVNGIANIIAGNIGGMAQAIEKALAGLVPIVIDFLAGLLGLGDLPQKVATAVGGIQARVEGILDKVVGTLATKAKSLFAKMSGKGKGTDDPDKDKNAQEKEKEQKVAAAKAGITAKAQSYRGDGKVSPEEAQRVASQVESEQTGVKINVVDETTKWTYNIDVVQRTKDGSLDVDKGGDNPYKAKRENGIIVGDFANFVWDGYSFSATPHPANKHFRNKNGSTVPKPTGKYSIGGGTEGNIHTADWRALIDDKKDTHKTTLEGIAARGKNADEKKQLVLANLGLTSDSQWSRKSLGRLIEDGAKYKVEQAYNGMVWNDLYLLEWDEHHIHPVNWGGPGSSSSNLQYIRRTEHSPITGWWNSARATLERLLRNG